MGNAARKARKKAGERFTKARKTPTRRYGKTSDGLGLITGAEILAALMIRGRL